VRYLLSRPDLLRTQARALARAVFVVDRDGVIRYIQVAPRITDEPDYEAALDAVRELM